MRFWPLCFLFILFSCSGGGRKGKLLARVGGTYLYEDELKSIVPAGMGEAEKADIYKKYASSWVKEQLVFQEAMRHLSRSEKNKDNELQDYYRSLIRYDYEKKLAADSLDKNITDKEIEEYYRQNQKNFELKRNIVRLLYVKIALDAPRREKVKAWIKNFRGENAAELNEYARKYADNYLLDTASWFYYDNITKEIPVIETYDPEHFLLYNNFVELKDGAHWYEIYILDKRIKEDISPLVYEKAKIKEILLNKRKVEVLQKIENNIYRKGQEENSFEIY